MTQHHLPLTIRKIVPIILLCLLSITVKAQQSDTLKVLFVGNSYTYFRNLPQMISTLAAYKGVMIKARKSTVGGATLKHHWEHDRNLKTRALIDAEDWDVVVLQNHSKSTIDTYDEFMDYGSKFVELIRKNGATPLLYMTWARAYNPLMQRKISHGYRTLAASTKAELAAVGEVWAEAQTLRPDLRLYDPDGSHPSIIGTYLTACVFFTHLTQQSAEGLPEQVSTLDKNGEELFYAMMDQGDAEFIHQLVDEMVLNPQSQSK